MSRPSTAVAVAVAWRAAPVLLRAVLEDEQVPAALGPVAGGWTVARLLVEDERVVEPRARVLAELLVDLGRSLAAPGLACVHGPAGARVVVACAPGSPPATAGVPGLGSGQAPEPAPWAAVLDALDRPQALAEVLALADGGPARRPAVPELLGDRRTLGLARALGVPGPLLDPELVDEPQPEREALVGGRLAAADVALAAGLLDRPLLLSGDGVVAAAEPDGVVLLPAAVQLAPLRSPVLVLWRQGAARGYLLVRAAAVEDGHAWQDVWQVVDLDPQLEPELRQALVAGLLPPVGDAALLARRFRVPEARVPSLRALLRRAPSPQVLDELCAALGLPAAAARVVEGAAPAAALPGAVEVPPERGARAVLRAATAPRPGDPWFVRAAQVKPWWYRLSDLALAALAVALGVGLLGGGALPTAGGVLLLVLALVSAVDGLTPGWGAREGGPPEPG